MAYRDDTLCGLFHNQALRFSDRHTFLMGRFDEMGSPIGVFRDITWKEIRESVLELARGLVAMGLERGQTAVIFSESRPEWIIADQAIQACGAIGVPLYPTVSKDELSYMIRDSEARIAIVSTSDKAREVLGILGGEETLKHLAIITMEPWDGAPEEGVSTLAEIRERGRREVPAAVVEERVQRVIPDDRAAIIYTSGTTGMPKGVVLTQGNFVANIHQITETDLMQRIKGRELHLTSLVHLPLCHVYGRTTDYHVAGLYLGGVLAFARDYNSIAQDILEVRPHVLTTIPRSLEKTYDIIMGIASRQKGFRKKLFFWALEKGRAYSEAMAEGRRLSLPRLNMYSLANILVFDRIKKSIGMDRLVMATSGGGKLSKDVCSFFRSMNIQLHEGYGLTETSPVINYNQPAILEDGVPGPVSSWFTGLVMDLAVKIIVERQAKGISPFANPLTAAALGFCYLTVLYKLRVKPGSVGRCAPLTEEKIARDGEILVRGPQVFSEYWKRPGDTEEAFTEDGWFLTGDIGSFDHEGFLFITDRKKELFVTSGGKNIAPHPIEVSLLTRPYIAQACLVGDARNYITALIVPDFREIERFAKKSGIEYGKPEELVKDPRIVGLIQAQVDELNISLPRYEQIKYFTLLDRAFSVETGELTPTLKTKRRVVCEKYREAIEAMYARRSE
jgi:long-chain acyl-CoA synthetase